MKKLIYWSPYIPIIGWFMAMYFMAFKGIITCLETPKHFFVSAFMQASAWSYLIFILKYGI